MEDDILSEPLADYVNRNLKGGFVLIVTGLPGSYKTETVEEVARLTGLPILRSDLLRLDVWKGEDVFDAKIAGDMKRRTQVYDVMFEKTREVVQAGGGVLLDATFVTQELRARAAEIAAEAGLPFFIMQTSCPREVSLQRIARRSKENYESNALTEEAYENNRQKFEPVDMKSIKDGLPGLQITHFVIETSSDAAEEWSVIASTVS